MIDLYTSATPNGWKITIALEELQVPYNLYNVDLSAGEQHSEKFLALNPNGRIPVIIDRDEDNFVVFDLELFCYIWQRRPENLCRRIQKAEALLCNG